MAAASDAPVSAFGVAGDEEQAHRDLRWLRHACELAFGCDVSPSAYNVGAVVIAADGETVLAEGCSRGRPGNTHAEENALALVGA